MSAEICFRHALADVRKDRTSGADDLALCLTSLAGVLQMQEQTQDAIPLYKKALHVLQKAHGRDSEAAVAPLTTLGDIFRDETQYKQSSRFYARALTIETAKSGPADLKVADLKHRLGLVAYRAGYPARAEKLYGASLDTIMAQANLPGSDFLESVLNHYIQLLRETNGGGKPLTSAFQAELLKDNLSDLARTRNTEDSAFNKEVSLQMLKSQDADSSTGAPPPRDGQAMPPQDMQASRSQDSQAPPPVWPVGADSSISDTVALEQINKQRLEFYERMIAIDAKTLGEAHPSMARDLTGLAYLYILQNNYGEAKSLLDRAIKIYQGTYGVDPLLVRRTELLSKLIERKERSDNRSPAFKEYLSTLPHIPVQAQTLEVAVRLNYLALLCYSEGKIADAEKISSWALPATALSCGEKSTLASACLNDYARLLRSAGRAPEAEKYEIAAYDILTEAMAKKAAALMPYPAVSQGSLRCILTWPLSL